MTRENEPVRVEIIAPVHNRRDITLQCLKSINNLDRSGLDIHVIIVDDGSTDGTSEAIRKQYPDVEIVAGNGELWFTAATNRGIQAALKHSPDYVLTINDDEVFDPQLLQRMVACAKENPKSVVGALLLLWDQPHRVFQVAPQWNVWLGGYRHWQQQTVWTVPDAPFEVDVIVGNCVLFPVEAIRECGLMNEKRLPHYGDAEFTPRMKRRGWRLLIEPSARVFCQPNTPPPSLGKMPLKKLFRTAFIDLGNANSVRRRFYANWYSAPNKLEALMSVPIFYLRYLLGKNIEGDYANQVSEAELKEELAGKIIRRSYRSSSSQ